MKLATVVCILGYYELFVGSAEFINQNVVAAQSIAAPFASLPSAGSWIPGINGAYSDLGIGALLLVIGHGVL